MGKQMSMYKFKKLDDIRSIYFHIQNQKIIDIVLSKHSSNLTYIKLLTICHNDFSKPLLYMSMGEYKYKMSKITDYEWVESL